MFNQIKVTIHVRHDAYDCLIWLWMKGMLYYFLMYQVLLHYLIHVSTRHSCIYYFAYICLAYNLAQLHQWMMKHLYEKITGLEFIPIANTFNKTLFGRKIFHFHNPHMETPDYIYKDKVFDSGVFLFDSERCCSSWVRKNIISKIWGVDIGIALMW